METADIVIVFILILSAILGLIKGFIREFFSLAALIVGLIAAFHYADVPVQWMPDTEWQILGETVRVHDVGFVISFVVITLIIIAFGRLLGHGFSKLVAQGGTQFVDKLFGLVFGLARGLLIAVLLVAAASLTKLPSTPAWQASKLVAKLQPLALYAVEKLPDAYARHFKLEPEPPVEAEES